jgi:hypothetical protein
MALEAILKAAVRFSEAGSHVQNENFRATLQRAMCKIPPKDEATAPEGGGRKVSTAAAADRPGTVGSVSERSGSGPMRNLPRKSSR